VSFLDWQGDSGKNRRTSSYSHRRDGDSGPGEDLQAAINRLEEEKRELLAAYRAAEAERKRYGELFHSAPEGCILTTPDGSILEANQAAAALIGTRPDRLEGRSLYDFLSPESRTACRTRLHHLKNGAGVQTWEAFLESRSGDPQCIAISVTPAPDLTGYPPSLRWVLSNVTEQRRAEAELRIKDSAIATSLNAVLIADMSGAIMYINRAGLAMWGYEDSGDLLGKRMARLFADDGGAEQMVQALSGAGEWAGEVTGRKRLGSEFMIRVAANTITDGSRHPLCMVVYGMDVTDQKRAESTLLQSVSLYRTIFDAAGTAILLVDGDGTIAVINAECERLSGYSRSDLEGSRLWSHLFAGDDRAIIREYLRLCRNNPAYAPHSFEVSLIDRSKACHNVMVAITRVPETELYVVSLLNVTEQRRVEAALQESEATFRGIAQRCFDMIFTLDRSGTITYISPAIKRLCGYLPEEVIGTSWKDYTLPKSHARIDAAINRLLDGAEIGGLVTTLLRKDGDLCFVEVNASPIVKNDTVVGVQGVGRDITDRVRTEEDLKIKEKAIASSVNAVGLIDRAGNLVYVNRAFLEMWGYDDPADVEGRPVFAFFQDQDALDEATELVAARGAWIGELSGLRKDGSVFDAQISASVVVGDDGNPVCIVAYGVDVTERKRTEEKLVQRNILLSALNQIIGISAHSLSLDELLQTSVQKILELTGNEFGFVYLIEGEGQRAVLNYHPGVPETLASRYATIPVPVWPVNPVYIVGPKRHPKDGSKEFPGALEARICDDIGASFLACVPLIAESKVLGALYLGSRRDEELSQERRVLLEAIGNEVGSGILRALLQNRLETANSEANLYLDIISHDIRNTNSVANLYCDLLAANVTGKGEGYVGKLRESIKKSSAIIKNVSTIRRLHTEETRTKPVDLDRVLRDELHHLPDVAVRYDAGSVMVLADDLLPEVFTNLIGNAFKFGGSDVEIDIRVEDEGECVRISVEDTGPGIPDALKPSIFNRFDRGGRSGSDGGLGLVICGMLIERYGGAIWVDDRVPGHPEEGAAFRFRLHRANDVGRSDAYSKDI
jgi:PAS domain S-box-containing protein